MLTYLGMIHYGNPFWWIDADIVLAAVGLAVLAP
jgi:hypothetical protein